MEDAELKFTDDALMAIAEKAVERKTGARGLRSIIENLLLDTMFDVPDIEDISEVIVEAETVKDNKQPVYKKKKGKTKKSKNKDLAGSKLKEATSDGTAPEDPPEKEAS